MPRSFQGSLTFGPPNQNLMKTSPLPHACHMSCPFNHPNNIRWRIQDMKHSCALTQHHALKAYWGSGCIAPLILWLRH
jgi:hypothetical protein